MKPSLILSHLRSAVQKDHADFEDFFKKQLETFHLTDYHHLISNLFELYERVEPLMLASIQSSIFTLDYLSRKKLPLLKEDLQSLNIQSHSTTRWESNARLETFKPAHFVGFLYTIEGATLGGQILFRHFNKTLGITPESGGRYFYGYGEKTGEKWKEFVQALEHYGSSNPTEIEDVIQGAKACFNLFHDYLGFHD